MGLYGLKSDNPSNETNLIIVYHLGYNVFLQAVQSGEGLISGDIITSK